MYVQKRITTTLKITEHQKKRKELERTEAQPPPPPLSPVRQQPNEIENREKQ